jgi:hypothetical protein
MGVGETGYTYFYRWFIGLLSLATYADEAAKEGKTNKRKDLE